MRLILTDVYQQIRMIVYQHEVETGVTLFGVKDGEDFKVSHVCGPGPKASHEQYGYSGDDDYSTLVYETLLKDHSDLKHLGELHVHPFGMKNMSSTDRETVKKVLETYEEFIAGVMLRTRSPLEVKFYPMYFSRNTEEKMEVVACC